MDTVKFFRVKELRDALKNLPDDRFIVCQTVGQDGGAWNMWGSFTPYLSGGTVSVLSFEHPDLKKLPDLTDETKQEKIKKAIELLRQL